MAEILTFTPEVMKENFPGFGMPENLANKLYKQFVMQLSNVDGYKGAEPSVKQHAKDLIYWFAKYTYNPTGGWQSPGGMWVCEILKIYFYNRFTTLLTESSFDELFAGANYSVDNTNKKYRDRAKDFAKNAGIPEDKISAFRSTCNYIALQYADTMQRALTYRSREMEQYYERFILGFKNKYKEPSPAPGISGKDVPFYFWTEGGKPRTAWDARFTVLLPDAVYKLINDLQSIVPMSLTYGDIIYGDKDGWYIEDTKLPYCQREGTALRHCGNQEGKSDKSQQIYSVRHKNASGDISAHLTITAKPKDKAILAMKGESNQKPKSSILPYVLDTLTLLLSDPKRVQVIVGDSYSPDNDININDFTDEQLRKIYKSNPDLIHTQAHLGDSKYTPKGVSSRVLSGFKSGPHKLDSNRYKNIIDNATQVDEACLSAPALYRLVLEGKVSRY